MTLPGEEHLAIAASIVSTSEIGNGAVVVLIGDDEDEEMVKTERAWSIYFLGVQGSIEEVAWHRERHCKASITLDGEHISHI